MTQNSIFNITKGTKTLMLIMIGVVVVALSIAYFYYKGINDSEDPRVIEAKHLTKKYNQYIADNNQQNALAVLDSILDVYAKFDDYKNSYETGVVFNNKAAIYLNEALYLTADSTNRQLLFNTSEELILKCIIIYKAWIEEFSVLSESEIQQKVTEYYNSYYNGTYHLNLDKIIAKRVSDILLAQKETPRRLSVCYTNLGIIKRHNLIFDEAMANYKKAIELWEDNHTARNNLNVMLGEPVQERSVIDKMFPPEKD